MKIKTSGYGVFYVINQNDTHYALQCADTKARIETPKDLSELPKHWDARLVGGNRG